MTGTISKAFPSISKWTGMFLFLPVAGRRSGAAFSQETVILSLCSENSAMRFPPLGAQDFHPFNFAHAGRTLRILILIYIPSAIAPSLISSFALIASMSDAFSK